MSAEKSTPVGPVILEIQVTCGKCQPQGKCLLPLCSDKSKDTGVSGYNGYTCNSWAPEKASKGPLASGSDTVYCPKHFEARRIHRNEGEKNRTAKRSSATIGEIYHC